MALTGPNSPYLTEKDIHDRTIFEIMRDHQVEILSYKSGADGKKIDPNSHKNTPS